MSIIKAPYNFVPLSNEVVTPEWVNHISHDIPFEDAKSGEIEVEITAHSPIFVRNGQPKNADTPSSDFSQHDGRYFIPGSSLKGMVRNVLEIMTFGKMGDKVNDHRYAIRDLAGAVKDQYLAKFKPDSIYAGWLSKMDDGSYGIADCGIPGRIYQDQLDKYLDSLEKPSDNPKEKKQAEKFSEKFAKNPNSDFEKSAKYKYTQIWKETSLKQSFIKLISKHKSNNLYSICKPEESDDVVQIGDLVFTGQPSANTGKSGKRLEFIFFRKKNQPLKVKSNIIDDFFFAYFDHDLNRQSVDWKHWRAELAAGRRIPVFFHKDKGQVSALGLSYLFKLPYKKSICDAMPMGHTETNKFDFSDVLFGFVQGESTLESLKGRVHFGHAFSKDKCILDQTQTEVLSSPKASYYPTYIRQSVDAKGQVNNYKTLMDEDAKVAGWKRYPVHKNGVKKNPPPQDSSEDVSVQFTPLQAGAQFSFSIRYHNLKKVELGALLSSITFHQTDQAFHSLGMAKPLGYGKVKLLVTNSSQEDIDLHKECLLAFEAYMSARVENWSKSKQLEELITMANEQNNTEESDLAYMKIDVKKKINQFTEAKNVKPKPEALNQYSKLPGIISSQFQPLLQEEDDEYKQAKKDLTVFKVLFKKPKNSDDVRNEQQSAFYKALEVHKQQLLVALNKMKQRLHDEEQKLINQELESQEKQKAEQQGLIREERSKQAWEIGPDFTDLKPEKSKVFEDLKRVVKDFVIACYSNKDKTAQYERLVKEMPNGVFPVVFHPSLIEIVIQIAKRDQVKWKTPYDKNANLKKLAEWIGEEKAKGLKF